MSTLPRHFLRRLLGLLLLAALVLGVPSIADARGDTAPRTLWSERALELFGSLPIQDGGRVKPVSTYASFTLLRLNGKRTLECSDGRIASATEWLLDVLFFPEDAARDAVFLVQDSDAVQAIGVDTQDKRKRDRWSYEALQPGMPRLFALAHEYDALQAKDRTTLQQQVVDLASNVISFLRLARSFDFARGGQPADADFLALVPPVEPRSQRAAWLTPLDLLPTNGAGAPTPQAHAGLLAAWGNLVTHRESPTEFVSALEPLHRHIVALADARGEYERIELERAYYARNPLGWSLGFFLAAFFAAALSWLWPRARFLHRVTLMAVLAGTATLVAAIVVRCILRERPPVSTLYETVLFVTAVGASLALVLEFQSRARIAIGAAAIVGVVGLFLANGYETLDKQDTMPSLVAVLDTNFWLATHVTAITVGYSAGLLAALLANLYLIGRILGLRQLDVGRRRELERMVYGVLCFALIFSIVGTILGGIWANESWGRFWGWDPKENGALLIVLSEIAILHARRGGFLREHGTCMAAAAGGIVIAFSWWGVNLLGVGLHSYGFTSGIQTGLWTYYGLQSGLVALGAIAWWRARVQSDRAARSAAESRVGGEDGQMDASMAAGTNAGRRSAA